MDIQHSPGPWKFKDEYVRTESGEIIADVYTRPTADTKPGEMEANGYLMAAAPLLLKACQAVLPYVEHLFEWEDGWDHLEEPVRLLRESINAATRTQ